MIDAVQTASASSLARGAGSVSETESFAAVAPTGAPSIEPGFGDIMAGIANGMVTDIRRGEQVSMAGLKGEASTQEVVEAVMSAERSLQTALAIRDKIVTAYLEISRMAI